MKKEPRNREGMIEIKKNDCMKLNYDSFINLLFDTKRYWGDWAKSKEGIRERWKIVTGLKSLADQLKLYNYIQSIDEEYFITTPYFRAVRRYILTHSRYRCGKCSKHANEIVYSSKYMRGAESMYLHDIFAICKNCIVDFVEFDPYEKKELNPIRQTQVQVIEYTGDVIDYF